MAQDSNPEPQADQPVEGARWQVHAILRVVVVVLATAATLWLLYALHDLLLLLILSIFFAYLVGPLVNLASRPVRFGNNTQALPRGVAAGLVYFVLLLLLVSLAHFGLPPLGRQVGELAKQIPVYAAALHDRIQSVNRIAEAYDLPPEAQTAVNTAVSNAIESAGDYLQGLAIRLLGLLSYLPWLLLVPILGFFFLKDGDAFRKAFLGVLPRGDWRRGAERFVRDIDRTLAAYVRAQLIACLLIGVVCTIGFGVLGVPFALVLGVLAGVFEFIPLVGPLALAVIATAIAGFSSTHAALMVLLFLAVLRVLEDYVIYPRIIGQGIHMHPLTVILAVLCGAEIAGIPGIFLSVPAAGIVSVVIKHVGGTEGVVADILQPAAPPSAGVEPIEGSRPDARADT